MRGTALLGRKQRVLVGLAFGCIGVAFLSVLVHRHLQRTTESKSDVTDLLRDIETTTGLRTGSIYVLGDPKSQEVIGRLIDYMVEPESRSVTKESWGGAMEALARIGRPAVPQLIEAIQNAPEKAASKRFADGTKLSDFGVQAETSKIQTRAAMVLGRIGDVRALPVLGALPSDNSVMSFYVKEAIKSIEKSNDHNTAPNVDQASSDDEMYEVYSTAIKELFLNKGERVKSSGADSAVEQLVVIRDQTTPYGAPGSDTVSAWRARGIAVDDETINDFRLKNNGTISLEPRFTVPAKQVLISDRDFARFLGRNGRSSPGFYERHRKSMGYIVLSRVGFNRDHNQALLYISIDFGGVGSAYYVILGRDEGAWSVKHGVLLESA
jgi:hypothetical protein